MSRLKGYLLEAAIAQAYGWLLFWLAVDYICRQPLASIAP